MYNYSPELTGERLRILRNEWTETKKAAGEPFTVTKFAEHIGYASQAIYAFEKGNSLTLGLLLHYCDKFNCEIDYLLGRIDKKTKEEQTICEALNISEVSAENLLKLASPGLDLLDSFLSQTSLLLALAKESFDSTHSHFTKVSFVDSVTGRKEELSESRSRTYIKQRALDIFSSMLDSAFNQNTKQAVAESVRTLIVKYLKIVVLMKASKKPKNEVNKFIIEHFRELRKQHPDILADEIDEEYANDIYNRAEMMLLTEEHGNIEDETIKEYIVNQLITNGLIL